MKVTTDPDERASCWFGFAVGRPFVGALHVCAGSGGGDALSGTRTATQHVSVARNATERAGQARIGHRSQGHLLSRGMQRNNEICTWPAIPLAYTNFRMEHAASLIGIAPTNPSLSLQLNPYSLVSGPVNSNGEWQPQAGGEVKWAVSPSTVIDATVNTDFAQTDVDQQVNNLGRFSIFFPESGSSSWRTALLSVWS